MTGWTRDLATRFPKHYETLRGVVRQTLVDRQLAEHLVGSPARICDVGGGAGHQALPLARRGYEVTILDQSEEMLRIVRRALDSEDEKVRDRVRLVPGPGEKAPDILERESFDAVLCHGVLMYLEDPAPLVGTLADIARSGALISILTKNADSLAMRPALEGRYRDALAAFDSDRDTGRLGVENRAHTVAGISEMLEEHGVGIEQWSGVRIFTDHLGDQEPGADLPELLEAEWEAGRRDPYRSMARLIHVLGRKKPVG
ncbi:MAG: methyltransferase domain-containing protein [Rubrobacteraceae bacterium]